MAIHGNKIGLVKESLIEMLHLAEYAVTYRKTDKAIWGDNATGGILGFPATVVLFSIIDCLGSYFANNENFNVVIDGKSCFIRNASQHIYILNSRYFNLDLSKIDLDNIYGNVRSPVTHNSLLPEGYILQIGENENLPFNIAINECNKRIYCSIYAVSLDTFADKTFRFFRTILWHHKISFLWVKYFEIAVGFSASQ